MSDEVVAVPEAQPQQRAISEDDALQFTHVAVLAGHVQALQQAFQAGAPQSVKDVHIDAIVDHAIGLSNAASVASEPEAAVAAPAPASVASDSSFKIVVGLVIALVALGVVKILHG